MPTKKKPESIALSGFFGVLDPQLLHGLGDRGPLLVGRCRRQHSADPVLDVQIDVPIDNLGTNFDSVRAA
jgi:hypothetical protein